MVVRNTCSWWTTEDLIRALQPILMNFLLEKKPMVR